MSDMGTKVKEMPEAQTLGANDLLYMVSSDTDYKVKGSTVKDAVKPAVMTGATSIAPGSEGLVPAPVVGDNTKYFSGGGTYKQPALSEMSDDATHRVVTDTEKTTWSNKQDALMFDSTPTDGSTNPVTSEGIYDALATKANSADLATVATTGDYDDLTGRPTIPVIEANPSGEATAEMQKLQIDSIIYKFATQKAYNEITDVDIASFSDGADDEPLAKLEVGIEAVQNLNGYDAPWPAGGGKNKINPAEIISGGIRSNDGAIASSSIRVTTGFIPVTEGVTYTVSIESGKKFVAWHGYNTNKRSVGTNETSNPITIPSDVAYIRVMFGFTDDSDISPSDVTKAQLEEGSTATDFEPYSNICPISGWDAVNVTRCGKNCFDVNSITVSNITFNTADGETTRSGFFYYLPQGTYTFKCNSATVYAYIYVNVFNANGEYVNRYSLSTTASGGWRTATITIDEGQYLAIYAGSAQATLNTEFMLQIEVGSSASDYEPYNGTTYPITWSEAGTVYGGELDVTNGVGISNAKTIDLGTLTWWRSDPNRTGVYYSSKILDMINVRGGLACNKMKVHNASPNAIADGEISSIDSYTAQSLFIKRFDFIGLTDEEVKEALSGTILCYTSTTKTSFNLDSPLPNIKTLLGNNNIWADSGQIKDVVYVRDLNTYLKSLDDRITALENA